MCLIESRSRSLSISARKGLKSIMYRINRNQNIFLIYIDGGGFLDLLNDSFELRSTIKTFLCCRKNNCPLLSPCGHFLFQKFILQYFTGISLIILPHWISFFLNSIIILFIKIIIPSVNGFVVLANVTVRIESRFVVLTWFMMHWSIDLSYI